MEFRGMHVRVPRSAAPTLDSKMVCACVLCARACVCLRVRARQGVDECA